jgi:8-oxo-dGTP diphosphatase
MRIRAGIVLVQGSQVALIERHRAGTHYFVFPGGGVDDGETPEQAAVRETREELGIEVRIIRRVAEIQFGQYSRQFYYLVEYMGGEFVTGQGEEYLDADPDDPETGTYHPCWMPVDQLSGATNIYPIDVARLVHRSLSQGWPSEPIIVFENPGR